MRCLLCGGMINWQPALWELIAFKPLSAPTICNHCECQFMKIPGGGCQGCGRQRSNLCRDCQQWQQQVGWVLHNHPLYRYNTAMKEYMHSYKFMGDYRLRMVFQKQLTELVVRQQADIIIPIPVHEATWQTRGFNQVEGLLDCLYTTDTLGLTTKQKAIPQSAKGRLERLQTVQPFVLKRPELVCQRKILLVDDVYTTGRTLYHAATLCRQAGCTSVESVTLAS